LKNWVKKALSEPEQTKDLAGRKKTGAGKKERR